MRVATATVSHETSTVTSGTTPLEAFETATGAELLSAFDSGRSLSGVVERLREAGAEVVPTVGAATIPVSSRQAHRKPSRLFLPWQRSALSVRP